MAKLKIEDMKNYIKNNDILNIYKERTIIRVYVKNLEDNKKTGYLSTGEEALDFLFEDMFINVKHSSKRFDFKITTTCSYKYIRDQYDIVKYSNSVNFLKSLNNKLKNIREVLNKKNLHNGTTLDYIDFLKGKMENFNLNEKLQTILENKQEVTKKMKI